MKTWYLLPIILLLDMSVYAGWGWSKEVNGYQWFCKWFDGKAEIIGYEKYVGYDPGISPKPQGHVAIPSSLGDATVVSIGFNAFVGCSEMTSVSMPDSVTSIGEHGFMSCSSLTDVTIPDGVTSIGGQAFSGCSGLTKVTIGNSVTSIKALAFANCRELGVVHFKGTPPSYCGGSVFSGVKSGAVGMYLPECAAAWESVIDANGYWQGLKMQMQEAPPLTLTAESADWSLGSITLKCEDGDLDGTAHLNPQYYDKSKKQWCDIDRDDLEILKPVVETDSSGNKLLVARLKDIRFVQRNNGVGTVSYRVADESGRASECSTRQRHALFVAVSEYADPSVPNLGNPSPRHEAAVIRSAYERYGEAGGFIKTCDDNPTKANALTWLEIMSESVTQPGDIFLLCFAGHGIPGFLCCHDYDKQNKEKGGITTNELFRCLTSFRDGIGLVSIIYCCNADGMFIQDNDSLNGGRIGWIFSSRTGENTIGGSLTDIVFSEGWFNGRADELNGEYGSGNGDGYVTFDELGKWGYDWTRANNYSGNNQHIEPQNTFILMNIVAGKVPSNSKPDNIFKWLVAKATSLFTASNGDVDAAAAMTAANGCRTVGECYELGIDPEDPNDDLKIAEFKMKDGKPEITLNHTKDGSGNSFEDRVKILGKAELSDAEWQEVPPDGNPAHRFFKVGVEMP